MKNQYFPLVVLSIFFSIISSDKITGQNKIRKTKDSDTTTTKASIVTNKPSQDSLDPVQLYQNDVEYKSIRLVPSSAAVPYVVSAPAVYENKLYFRGVNNHLVGFDPASLGLTLVTNPDAGAGYFGYPILANGKLYIQYSIASNSFISEKGFGMV